MVDNRTDNELIEAIKKEDFKAFDVLVLRYQSRVIKIVNRLVNDQHEAMDVCQEVFIKIFRSIHKFRGDSAFYTWLYRIAMNTAKNHVVSRGKRLVEPDIRGDEFEHFLMKHQPKDTATPEDCLIRDEVEKSLYDSINDLPQDLKEALTLRELEGKSYEAIADIMHCPVGTVRSRIFRARHTIDRDVH